MEIVVGSTVGAVAGALVGWPGLYLQRRMKRKDDIFAFAKAGATEVWEAAHLADAAIGQLLRDRGPVLTREFYERVDTAGRAVLRHSMILTPSSRESTQRLSDAGSILRDMARNQGRVSDEELSRCALEVIRHIQWVCAAYLTGRPIPDEPPTFRVYGETFRDVA
ncbi:hypothetical protein ACFW6F_03480 [Streptomyces sp. NPDC058746]|uniref:hypothetical protein n=1 Tax=Streptomyces sp. NPDC058746 TaxID=3346622 RepID=UPI0036B5D92A